MKQKKMILLAVLCVVCVGGMALALAFGQRTEVRFEPPPFDSTAVKGTPASDDLPKDYNELDATAYRIAFCSQPVVDGKQAYLYFTNQKDNHVLLKVCIMDQKNKLLGESGLLRPGEYVPSVTLNSSPSKTTDVTIKVIAYEEETYHSAGNVTLQTSMVVK